MIFDKVKHEKKIPGKFHPGNKCALKNVCLYYVLGEKGVCVWCVAGGGGGLGSSGHRMLVFK